MATPAEHLVAFAISGFAHQRTRTPHTHTDSYRHIYRATPTRIQMHVHAACFTKNVSTHDKAKTNNSSSSVVEHSARNIATTTTSCSIAVTGTRLTPRCSSSSPSTPLTCLCPLQFPFPLPLSLASIPLPWSLQCKQAPAKPNNNSLGQLHTQTYSHTHTQRERGVPATFVYACCNFYFYFYFCLCFCFRFCLDFYSGFRFTLYDWLLFHASFLVCLLFLLVALPFPLSLFLFRRYCCCVFSELPQSFQLSQDKAAATTAATKYGSTHTATETKRETTRLTDG